MGNERRGRRGGRGNISDYLVKLKEDIISRRRERGRERKRERGRMIFIC